MSKRFTDFAKEETPLDGDKMRIDDILNCEIEIIGHRLRKSKFKKEANGMCLTIQFLTDEVKRVVFTGSEVLIDQLDKYGDEIPFLTTIKKIDKYYTLT